MTKFREALARRHILTAAFRVALDSLRAHMMRSFLTLLGMIIGVGSVVVVGAAIEGLGAYAQESTSKLFGGETYLVAQVGRAVGRKEYFDKLRRNKPIRPDDLAFLEAATGDRVLYSPYLQRPEEAKAGGLAYENALALGVSATMAELRDVAITEGRFFTAQEERTRQAVAVIGDEVQTRLFPGVSAVGRTVKISGIDFTVVGVQEKLGYVMGASRDNSIFIPATVFRRLYGPGRSVSVFARARPGAGLTMDEALDLTRVALRARFRLRPGEPDKFDTVTPDAIRIWAQGILATISSVVVPITSISLLVGGIVIMNIMLVSVSERTGEIGIRKSVGARQSDIRLQFLIEALMLTAIGGLIGVAVGAAAAQALGGVFGISMRITAPYVMLALTVSSSVGVAAGWYPAIRAARLDPVAALRAE